ncbi:hypothetical protein KBZ18_10060 [Synechococcus sp. Cruz-9H2]|uniref:hypothetical protein n=1 Tax=unclassified Synechococcus TaxID=2626047 RepID=UPI0020CF81EA|nr:MULTISPECIES: hypothetical protein [unclassified Synechococcus]MCP9819836.1 hypothetical protein [Synechococcus sp. Cruz-9H2]MCP9844098.1 hypothetical protein [Synechococcus sp. Edmonson 11F2]MCP9856266.1 hypothetical protein [Synechococcus sp. Cruz-9C9]MCP9863551.1 hypothetical protein [Synechococcus sp. Cruz-7E5]MCP9870747.1 hypothetical protein [Synechococcus sp. Cruz-7B9]
MKRKFQLPGDPPAPGPVSADGKPRRYGRRTHAHKVGVHLWPDVFQRLEKHAEQQQLTLSGAAHDCLRRFFKLPTHPG